MSSEERRVVARVKAELARLYGERLRRVILFGSRARGDAREDSDYDFVAVLDEVGQRHLERDRLSDLGLDLLLKDGLDVSVFPATDEEFGAQTLFMHNVRTDGIPAVHARRTEGRHGLMTPITADLLARAEADLAIARRVLDAGVASVAGREAYLAMFHAAQAVIFELTGKGPKSHKGVHVLFAQLARENPSLGSELPAWLRRAYGLKQQADYDVKVSITAQDSIEALDRAGRLLAAARHFLETREAS